MEHSAVSGVDEVMAEDGLSGPCVVPGTLRPVFPARTSMLRVVPDNDGITAILRVMCDRSGQTKAGIATSMGIGEDTLRQYLAGIRHPGSRWLARFAAACGAEVVVNFPNVYIDPRKR